MQDLLRQTTEFDWAKYGCSQLPFRIAALNQKLCVNSFGLTAWYESLLTALFEQLWVKRFGFAVGSFNGKKRAALYSPQLSEHDSRDKPMPTKDVVFKHRTKGASARQIRVGFQEGV